MNLWIDCEKKPITELLEFVVDNRGKSVPTTDKGHILIATNCIRNDHLYPKYEKIRYLSQETYETFFRSHPLPGDIIFVNKGTPGRVCLVPDPIDFCIAQDMIALRANKDLVDSHYLFAVLRSPMIQTQIHNTYVGDVIPHFKKQFMDRLLIPLPSMKIQKKIGEIYYTICDKIEVNRRINEQLEELAGALFKSWFVDFEPFKDGEFVDSELGMIPKGWKVGTLSDIGEVVGGATPSKSKSEYYTDNGISWITPKDLSINKDKFISKGEIDITELGYSKCSAKMMPRGSVLFSSRAPIGYIAIAKNELCTNQGFKSVVPQLAGTAFIYYYLKNNVSNIESMASGSTFKEASGALMKSLNVIVPESNILQDFEEKVCSIFDKQESLEEEIHHLTTLRDTLLPKLMSGEIDVNEVEI